MPSLSPGRDTWPDWRQYIIKELERLVFVIESLRTHIAVGDEKNSKEIESLSIDLVSLIREVRESLIKLKDDDVSEIATRLTKLETRMSIVLTGAMTIVTIVLTGVIAAIALRFIHP